MYCWGSWLTDKSSNQAQTPQQRRANTKFAKTEEKKMGKPESVTKKKDKPKPPVSKAAISESPFFFPSHPFT